MTQPADAKFLPEQGLTFDDVLLVPRHSTVHPTEVDVSTRLAGDITLNIPLVSAAMDTVTESRLAIALAQDGGLGVIHRNLQPADQAAEVDRVKRSESGMILDPVTLEPAAPVREALALMSRYHISGVPITQSGRLVGILTNRDLRFLERTDLPIAELMTREGLVTAPVGTDLEEAKRILHQHRIEKLPVVDAQGTLRGLITVKDIMKRIRHPYACKDSHGRLRVGAAIGTGAEHVERTDPLVEAGVDVLVVDSAHGHSERVLETVRAVKKRHGQIPLIAGNVATPEGTAALIGAGADAVKVGIGPSAICTTRVVSGAGVPQFTAIRLCAVEAARHGIPVIADGGIRYSGDIAKAIGAGSAAVMVGSLFAGTEESPGDTMLYEGRSYKVHRGMGSVGAMEEGSSDRYFQEEITDRRKLVPEGIEGRVPYRGPLSDTVYQLVGGLRAGMGYCGCRSIPDMHGKAVFMRVSAAGAREGHPHSVTITREAPNYPLR